MNAVPPPAPVIEPKPAAHVITVSHASWGVGCHELISPNTTATRDPFAGSNDNKIHPDNVLKAVAALCNGKPTCDVSIDPAVLGEDPLPNCAPKTLEIEYRCFSYDRPWIVKGTDGSVNLHCDTPTPPKP